jgi:D-serine deaminase-like pyridoxal phosphate-dependent protein
VPDAARRLAELDVACADLTPPFAVVDLDAFDANRDDMARRAAGKPIRVASKSVRCRALIDRALDHDGYRGILAYSVAEALWLDRDDVLVAYPSVDREALAAVGERVTVMVDCAEHLDLLQPGTRVCLDVDAGLWLAGGRVRIGAKRSPLHTPAQAAAMARAAVERGLRMAGVMLYESQVAGIGDGQLPVRLMKRVSVRELARRRAAVVAAVQAVAGPLEIVNAGGTGSLETSSAEAAVTEVAAGSGLLAPTLFDAYARFAPRPAAFFVLPVVRRPSPGVATLFSGGYVASGAAGTDRLPAPVHPPGLRLDRREGAGEVQTPVLGADLAPGDRVWLRHAKAGELCERFDALHLVQGGSVVAEVPTYRGEGRNFG